MKSVIVVGAGGFGREILDVLRDQDRRIRGVVDDAPSAANLALLHAQDVPWLGTVDTLIADGSPDEFEFLIGVGSSSVRETIDRRLTDAGFEAGRAIHSSATWGFGVTFAPGVVVCAGTRLTTNIEVGRHVHLNLNVTVGHDTVLGDYTSVNPGAAVSGSVTIEKGVLVGANAFILQGLTVGEASLVGASSAVVRTVAPRTTVAGVPARLLSRHS